MRHRLQRLRDWLADRMEIDEPHKMNLYIDVAQGASLLQLNYWLELIFAAGIATLGLALNSPAVIIGAMLISPLMSPILSMGLSLASGDFVLAVLSAVKLFLSCTAAIALATLLVYYLPFKEITSEIAARTQPNVLDLFVALFSGAIGSISTCKPMRGIVTSIPGVAIAVALMPPLCVVGHGIGIATSHSVIDGLRVAQGGFLLFLTNLVAITFTAMIVFLLLYIDTDNVKLQVKEWHQQNRESQFIQMLLSNNRFLQKLRPIGSLPGRLLIVLSIVGLLFIPLSRAIDRLTQEVSTRNEENRIRRVVREVWNQQLGRYANGELRSSLQQLTVQQQGQELVLGLTIVTNSPLTRQERQQYVQVLAQKLQKSPDQILVNLIEIPTTQVAKPLPEIGELNWGDMYNSVLGAIEQNIRQVQLPGEQQLVGYKVLQTGIEIAYLADQPLSRDAAVLLQRDYARTLPLSNITVKLRFIDRQFQPLPLARAGSELAPLTQLHLDRLASLLADYPRLRLQLSLPANDPQLQSLVKDYFAVYHHIPPDRVATLVGEETGAIFLLAGS